MSILKKLLLSIVLFAAVKINAQTLEDGLKAWSNENFITAGGIFKKVSDADPSNANALFYYGQALFKTGDINGAKSVFEKGVIAKPGEFLCVVGLAKCALESGDMVTAEKKIESALKGSRSKDPDVLRFIADAYSTTKNKDWTKAIDFAQQAVNSVKGKSDFNTFNTLGDVYFDKHYSGNGGDKDIGSAVANYELSYQLNSKSPYAMTKIAKVWSTTRMEQSYKLTIDALEKAASAQPDFIPLHGVYAIIYEKTGQYEKAKIEQQIYMDGCEDKIKPNDRMINILYKLKDWKGTLVLAKKMNEIAPNNCDYLRVLGQANTELGNYSDAVFYFNQYMSKCDLVKMDIEDFTYLAKANKGIGNDSASIRYYYKMILLDSSKEQAILKEIANGYYSARKFDLAIDAFKNLIAKYPTPNALYKLMDCYYQSKKWKETEITADTFIAQNPGNPLGYLYKAKGLYFLDTANEHKTSIDMYKVFLEKTKDTLFAKTFLPIDLIEANGKIMQYYVNKTNYKEALIYSAELVRLDPANANYQKYKEALEKRIKTANNPPKPNEKPNAPVKPK